MSTDLSAAKRYARGAACVVPLRDARRHRRRFYAVEVDVRQEGPVVLHGLLEVHLVRCGPAVTRPLEITLGGTEVLPVPGSGERAAAVVSPDGELVPHQATFALS